MIASQLPRQGVPPIIASWEQFAEDLAWAVRGGAVTDASEWWWELRPHVRYGTLELRVLDVQATVDQTSAIARLVHDATPAHLRPGGVLLLVHSSLIGIDATLQRLRTAGLVKVEVRACERGPLGPLMRAQQAAGTIPADVDEEDVAIIRATAPPARR